MSEENGFSEESLRRIAAQKVSYRFSVRIHLVIYILVNILLIIINVLTSNPIITFQTAWFIYPLLGWLIGMAIHTVSYLIFAKGIYPNSKRSLILHITSYLTVISLLIVINIQTLPQLLWVLWPGIIWGASLAGHITIYFIYFKAKITEKGDIKSRKDQAIEKEMEKMRKRMERKK